MEQSWRPRCSIPRAVEISVYVVRAFVELRNLVAGNKELASKLRQLERKVATHDQEIAGLIDSMRRLMDPPESQKRAIGFIVPEERGNRK